MHARCRPLKETNNYRMVGESVQDLTHGERSCAIIEIYVVASATYTYERLSSVSCLHTRVGSKYIGWFNQAVPFWIEF